MRTEKGRQTMQAKDLTKEYPRSPLAELEGFPWLPRLIDKVRAKHAGTLGEYTPYPCGADKRFLTFFGLDQDGLETLIRSSASEAEIAAWCRANAQGNIAEAAAKYRETQRQPIPPERAEILQEALEELAIARPDLDLTPADNFTKLILLEEGHPWPAQAK